jgi:translation initiation factor IF-3
VLDYSKYKYEQAQKLKQARKHQQQITIREIKFRPKIAENDYNTKKGHVARFLRHKDKVKITIMFRGREVTHPERGVMILDRLAEELAELAVIEQRPIQDGRNMTMMLGPSKAVLSGEIEAGGDDDAPDADVDGAVTAADDAAEAPAADATPEPVQAPDAPSAEADETPVAAEKPPPKAKAKAAAKVKAPAPVAEPEPAPSLDGDPAKI